MELALNLVWLAVSVSAVVSWLRWGTHSGSVPGASRRRQLVCLGTLLVVTFPMISMTDDCWAAHNPAETDTSIRRDHLVAPGHTIGPALPAWGACAMLLAPMQSSGRTTIDETPCLTLKTWSRSALFTRPPPPA